MRRKEREITDRQELLSVMERCDVCRLAVNDGAYPAILPLSFGVEDNSGQLCLWFHSAPAGRKIELLRQNSKVSFEMDCSVRLITDKQACRCTMTYESVIGQGVVHFVEGSEKRQGLDVLMAHYCPGETFSYDSGLLSQITVMRLDVISLTGKRNI